MKTVGLVLDPLFEAHDTGHGHPERPLRLVKIREQFNADGLIERCESIAPRAATDEEILLCHTAPYLKTAIRDIESGADSLSTGDTNVCGKSLEVARKAVGSALQAVEMIFEKKLQRAFAAMRPPGHHATATAGMGFCIFNNAAIAARHAQKKYGVERVVIIDWDVHHGNGTQDIFYEDGSVFYFSTHQSPWYPGTGAASETGEGKGKGTTLNCPFKAGASMVEIGAAFREKFLPAMQEFKPQFVIISAGFDSRIDDPLGGFRLTDANFAELTKLLRELAEKHSEGRVLSLLEGGYNVTGLAKAASAHLSALLE